MWFHGALGATEFHAPIYRLAMFVPVSRSTASADLDERCHRLVPVSGPERRDVEPDTLDTFDGTFCVSVTLHHTKLTRLMRSSGCAVGFGVDNSHDSIHERDLQNTGAVVRLPVSAPCPFVGVRYNDGIVRTCQCTAQERHWNVPWHSFASSNHIRLTSIPADTHYIVPKLRRAEDFVVSRHRLL